MNCPNCDAPRVPVEETRSTPHLIYRVRRCTLCGWRVTTHETYADDQAIPKAIRRASEITNTPGAGD